MTAKTYGADHPMVRTQTGDPARGLFRPWEGRKRARRGR